jgi:hypothetical protein
MNLDFDFTRVTRFFRSIGTELREKRLWPVALLLLVALVAVPLLLANSSSPAPEAQVPVPAPPPSPATSIPTLEVQSTPAHSRLNGAAHDPFTLIGGGTSSTASGSTAASTVTATSTAVASSSPNSVSGGSSTSSASSSTSGSSPSTSSGSTGTSPPSITPNAKPKPAPSGLTSTHAYDVSLAITNSAGGLNTIDPLKRLSVLPSDQQPLLVELGVLKGGRRVLFAVEPGTVVDGPGTCTPGPIDCEILSLGQDQTESISTQTGLGTSQVALFAVTGLTTTKYSSAAAADRARRSKYAAGQALLNKSALPALSLFQYQPSLGYVVDLRNVTVGR